MYFFGIQQRYKSILKFATRCWKINGTSKKIRVYFLRKLKKQLLKPESCCKLPRVWHNSKLFLGGKEFLWVIFIKRYLIINQDGSFREAHSRRIYLWLVVHINQTPSPL